MTWVVQQVILVEDCLRTVAVDFWELLIGDGWLG
jgi:hypothetical protein